MHVEGILVWGRRGREIGNDSSDLGLFLIRVGEWNVLGDVELVDVWDCVVVGDCKPRSLIMSILFCPCGLLDVR